MKKKLISLLAVTLIVTNCMYVSAAPLTVTGDAKTLIVEEENSEEVSEEESEEISEEEPEEEISEEISEEDKSEEDKSEEDKSEEDKSEDLSEEENSEEADSEDMSEPDDFNDEDIKNIDDSDDGEIVVLEESAGDFEYNKKTYGSDRYIEITKYTGKASAVTIPNTIENLPVKAIGSSVFSGKATLRSVTLPANLETIGYAAFRNCNNLQAVELKEGLKEIGQDAFSNCVQLQKVTIPGTVTRIGASAFSNCSGITSVTIKNSVIGESMFRGCTKLPGVKIPSSVTSFGNYSFMNCTALKNAVIEANTTIGFHAFDNCPILSSVTLKNVKGIGRYAFVNTGLTAITIPNTVSQIGEYAFSDCVLLKSVQIPSSVTEIDSGIFYGCTGLESVSLSGGSVSDNMFNGCKSLKEITIPASVDGIGPYAFENCTSLEKAVIRCSGEIGSCAFSGCNSLTTVELQNSQISSIKGQAFNDAPVTTVKFPYTMMHIGSGAFSRCKKLKTLTLNEGLTSMDFNAFSDCTSLQSVVIPSTVNSVGRCCFINCTSLCDIAVKNSVIAPEMFEGCTGLKSVAFSANVREFGWSAFYNCSSLKVAMFAGNPPAIFEDGVFSNCNSNFEIRYLKGAVGWTNPWKGYKTKSVDKFTGNVYPIFEDVTPTDWYLSSVQFVYDKGIMTGTAPTVFGANTSIKREQVVQVFYANEGKPAVSGTSGFSDVKSTDWYNKAVIWAKNKGITSGKPDGTFGVGNDITRESLAIMLYKYAQLKKIKTKKTTGASNGYADSGKISPYAKDAMDWAVTQGVLSGKGSGSKSQMRLDPQGKATRAEFAAMMTKLLQ